MNKISLVDLGDGRVLGNARTTAQVETNKHHPSFVARAVINRPTVCNMINKLIQYTIFLNK